MREITGPALAGGRPSLTSDALSSSGGLAADALPKSKMNTAIRILGIDPGLRHTGWGAIVCAGSSVSFLGAGTVTAPVDAPLAERLAVLFDGLLSVIAAMRPDEAAVELTFVNKDAGATLKLGQARGIAMLAPARSGLAVAEYAPNLIKKTIVGAGHGDKRQVRMMVGVLLPRAKVDSADAAAALAVAHCPARHRASPNLAAAAAAAAAALA
jgi:crossover junction endodeoxyribonuclease RuvC